MTDTAPEPQPDENSEPTTDSWAVSDSANELGVDAFDVYRALPGEPWARKVPA